MKRVFILLVSLFAMMAASLSAKAQQITITLYPGVNWISYPNAEAMDIASAFGSFTPAQGDIIKSQYTSSVYSNGGWMGGVTHLVPGSGYKYYSNRTEVVDFSFAQPASNAVATATPTGITATSAIVGGMVILPEGTHVFLRGVCWGTESNPDIDGDHTSDGTGIGSFSSTLEGLNPNTTYYVRAYAVSDHGLAYGNDQSFTTEAGGGSGGDHAYVDLGLPSGLLWATCNVGADSPEDYGDYFAWGETQPKVTYDWSTYQYCNGSNTTLTKYCNNSDYGYNGFTDNLTTLLPEDDAATANWGSDWRMPTKEEWQELYNNTTHTWTTQNGVNGRLFTASNGNSLFLPAAGYRSYGSLLDAGMIGVYWSSSLSTDSPSETWYFYINSVNFYMDNDNRSYGQSVRPVRSESQNNTPTGAINGKFTINEDGDQVYFSQGNLQYIGSASTPYWKFADNQWDYLSSAQNGSSQYKDRDLFCWGTSGYNHGANCYQPWSVSTNSSDYYAYGNYSYNLYDQTRKADWGYNAISNGGNRENSGWRTPSHAEWAFVFNTRSTTSGIRYAKANVNNVNGVILLPDDWSTDYYSLNSTNTGGASYNSNTITAEQWSALEQYGAVFLPAAFYSWEGHVYASDSIGFYWSASVDGWRVGFSDMSLHTDNTSMRCSGRSVRLIRNVE